MAPHRRNLGWIRWDDSLVPSWRRSFHVYSHCLDEIGRHVRVKLCETIGSATAFIRQHTAEMAKLNAPLEPDSRKLVNGVPIRKVNG